MYAEKLRVPPPSPPHTHWAETTHGRNDSRPKRPTKIGRMDSPQNLAETNQAETTHGRNDTRPKRPGTLLTDKRLSDHIHILTF